MPPLSLPRQEARTSPRKSVEARCKSRQSNPPIEPDGFNSINSTMRQGRRRSSLEVELVDIRDSALNIQVNYDEIRAKHQREIEKADQIVRQCSVMSATHSAAMNVINAMKFKRCQSAAEGSEYQQARDRVNRDLAELRGMVNTAKQSACLVLLRDTWWRMLLGHSATLLMNWRGNASMHLYDRFETIESYACVVDTGRHGILGRLEYKHPASKSVRQPSGQIFKSATKRQHQFLRRKPGASGALYGKSLMNHITGSHKQTLLKRIRSGLGGCVSRVR